MAQQIKPSKKGSKAKGAHKLGRGQRTKKYARWTQNRQPVSRRRKLKHTLKSNGVQFAQRYATLHSLQRELARLMA